MSIDYGDKRVGVALSDPMHTISYPLCVINRKNDSYLINELFKIISEKQIEKIIIGLPLSMSGSYSEQTKKVVLFKDILFRYNIEIQIVSKWLVLIPKNRIFIKK